MKTTVTDRAAKDALYEAFALIAKAFANGRRVEIVDVLGQGERCVEDLAREIGQSEANTSQHLGRLAAAGLVQSRRSGNRVLYRLAGPHVAAGWRALRALTAEYLPQLDRLAGAYLGDRSDIAVVSRHEVAALLDTDEVLLLDTRPDAEYAAGHIRGARHAPVEDLANLPDVPAGVQVVAYCRGPYCAYADEAVRYLASRGVTARRLQDGFPEWADAGLPVDTGDGSGPGKW